jgi:hypothetical protein
MFAQLLSAKAAVAAGTLAALLAGGTAAAATGSLSVPAQTAVSSALSHVGVSVPTPNSHANSQATDNPHRVTPSDAGDTSPADSAKGPDATGPAKFGLCTAWAATPTPNAHSHKHTAVAFANLQKAAGAAGMSVTDYCKGVTPPSEKPETTTTPTTGSHGPSSSPGKSGEHTSHATGSDAGANGTHHGPPANSGTANATTDGRDGRNSGDRLSRGW